MAEPKPCSLWGRSEASWGGGTGCECSSGSWVPPGDALFPREMMWGAQALLSGAACSRAYALLSMPHKRCQGQGAQ